MTVGKVYLPVLNNHSSACSAKSELIARLLLYLIFSNVEEKQEECFRPLLNDIFILKLISNLSELKGHHRNKYTKFFVLKIN